MTVYYFFSLNIETFLFYYFWFLLSSFALRKVAPHCDFYVSIVKDGLRQVNTYDADEPRHPLFDGLLGLVDETELCHLLASLFLTPALSVGAFYVLT